MNMVERVARAIDPDLWTTIDSDSYAWSDKERMREGSLNRARSGLEELRKPTEAMPMQATSSTRWGRVVMM